MNRFQTSTVVARTRTVRAAGAFDPDRDGAEDWDLWTRMARRQALWLTPCAMVTYRRGARRVSHDAARVYRRGLALLVHEGAAPADIAWHHLRFAYALWRRGLGAESNAAYAAFLSTPDVGAGVRARLLAEFACLLADRGARQAASPVARRVLARGEVRPGADAHRAALG